MHIREVAVGDTVLAVSEKRGITVHGVVTDRQERGAIYIGTSYVGQLGLGIVGDDWAIEIVQDWPADELQQARAKARKFITEAESNVADKVLLERAMEIAIDHLQERVDRRRAPAGPFWRRGKR